MSEPRAYTAEEVRDLLIKNIRARAKFWADLPEVDRATGKPITIQDRCNGVAFSILTLLDGCADMPAFDLVPSPHKEDKSFHIGVGENWYERVVLDFMLHEYYYQSK